MSYDVQIKGQEKVIAHLKKLANPQATFDKAINETAVRSKAELAEATLTKRPSSTSFFHRGQTVVAKNLYTGETSRAWTNPFKISNGYAIINNKKTADGKYLIAEMLEKGRKEIRPVTKKMLYMPLTRRGQKKAYGAKPIGLKYGEDFILLKKVRAMKGRNFMKRIIDRSSRFMTREIIKDIRKVFAT